MSLKKKTQAKVPVGALNLVETGSSVRFQFSDPGDDGSPALLNGFEMVGYSGGVIPDHWYWGNLAISLSGIKFSKEKYPILRDHLTNMEIGFSSKPTVDQKRGLIFTEKEVTFLDNEESRKFIENSKAGFPYQASIRAEPTRILRLGEGEEREVNGFVLKGPGTVWLECTFKECSVCVFGYDSNTSSKAFSEDGEAIPLSFSEGDSAAKEETIYGGTEMNPKEFAEKHPEAFAAIVKKAKEEATQEFQQKLDDLQGQVTKFQNENKDLTIALQTKTTENAQFSERLTTLEAKAAKAQALSHAVQAETIFNEALGASSIPADLHPKVKAMVSFGKFVKDGEFDATAFKGAVDEEVKDWASKLPKGSSVQGFSAVQTTVFGDEDDEEEAMSDNDKAVVEAMSKHLTQPAKKQ